MKTITIDGKEYNLVPVEQEEKQEKRTGWERVGKEWKYFNFNGFFKTEMYYESFERIDDAFYREANYRNDDELNENICRAVQLRLKMLQWQALNDEPVDIYNDKTIKWYIYWNEELKLLQITCDNDSVLDIVYFSSREKVEEALEVFKDELLWYYTQFYRRLDERK